MISALTILVIISFSELKLFQFLMILSLRLEDVKLEVIYIFKSLNFSKPRVFENLKTEASDDLVLISL